MSDQAALLLVVATGCWVVVAAALADRERLLPRRLFAEAAAALVLLAVGAFGVGWLFAWQTRQIARKADARWTAIGLPMAEFEASLASGPENEGSQVVRQVLQQEVGMQFYREEPTADSSGSRAESEELYREALQILQVALPPGDEVDLPAQDSSVLARAASDLKAEYRRIAREAPPRWATDPHDGTAQRLPNFVALRKFTQIASADTLVRLSSGDLDGAAAALAAGQRLRDGLWENPTLVSLLLGVAVDGLLASKQVRLPAAEDDFSLLTHDAEQLRTEFVRRLQVQAWAQLRYPGMDSQGAIETRLVPPWLLQRVNRLLSRRQSAYSALNGALHANITKSPGTLKRPDLGEAEHEAIATAHRFAGDMNPNRAFCRLNATLLLREQVALIRRARAECLTGSFTATHRSVVIPGLKWEIVLDREASMVRTRLVNPPAWVLRPDVTGPPSFWVLPIDGSVGWKLRLSTRTAAAF